MDVQVALGAGPVPSSPGSPSVQLPPRTALGPPTRPTVPEALPTRFSPDAPSAPAAPAAPAAPPRPGVPTAAAAPDAEGGEAPTTAFGVAVAASRHEERKQMVRRLQHPQRAAAAVSSAMSATSASPRPASAPAGPMSKLGPNVGPMPRTFGSAAPSHRRPPPPSSSSALSLAAALHTTAVDDGALAQPPTRPRPERPRSAGPSHRPPPRPGASAVGGASHGGGWGRHWSQEGHGRELYIGGAPVVPAPPMPSLLRAPRSSPDAKLRRIAFERKRTHSAEAAAEAAAALSLSTHSLSHAGARQPKRVVRTAQPRQDAIEPEAEAISSLPPSPLHWEVAGTQIESPREADGRESPPKSPAVRPRAARAK
jgi:hypothetical protein